MEEKPIGVYDSGIGGLTLLAECVKMLPEKNFIYYGDNRNAPYGNKPREELLRLSRRVFDYFSSVGVCAVVVACNTVTTQCVSRLREEYPFPVIGTEPAVRLVADCRHPLVLATKATLHSDAYLRLCSILKNQPVSFAPGFLVAQIEKNAPFFEKIGIADHLPKIRCDGVVLGCTHFIYLKKEISCFYDAPCFDGNFGTAKRLKNILSPRGSSVSGTNGRGKICFVGSEKEKNKALFKRMFIF